MSGKLSKAEEGTKAASIKAQNVKVEYNIVFCRKRIEIFIKSFSFAYWRGTINKKQNIFSYILSRSFMYKINRFRPRIASE